MNSISQNTCREIQYTNSQGDGFYHLNNAAEGAGERSYKTWAEYMPLFLYWMETFSLLINYSFMRDYFFTP